MIPRYTPKCMKDLWSNWSKYNYWLKVELALLEAKSNCGEIALEVFEAFRDNATFTVERIDELDAEIQHDLQAFVQTVQESIKAAGYPQFMGKFHDRITSYDTEDPALILQLRKSAQLILGMLQKFRDTLYEKAVEHKFTLMIGRTHGQFAVPDTFGRLLLDFVEACDQSIRRLEYIIDNELGYAKLSGAIGNYADLDPMIEEKTLALLKLKPARVATQIRARDGHATFINELATIGGTMERLAVTLWTMSHSLVAEVRESRKKKQKGSTAMPQKKNPIFLEQVSGLAVMLRGYASMLQAVIVSIECRDIRQSCVERVVFPDATCLIYYLLERFARVIGSMKVFSGTMKENLDSTYGTWVSQRIKVALLDAEIDPEIVYDHIQMLAFQAMDERVQLQDLLAQVPIVEDKTAVDIIGEELFHQLFDPEAYISDGVGVIFDRFEAA